MSVITKLGEGRNKNKRVSVFVDDQFICFLNSFTIFKYKLAEGQEIDLESLKNIQMENEQDTAFDLAIGYLSKYVKTKSEVEKYLLGKGFLPELVECVVNKIQSYNYIDDQKYTENFISCNKNRYGIHKMKMMLKQRGVEEGILSKMQKSDNSEILDGLVQKYMRNRENNQENRQKCAKFLYGRGFDWEEIGQATGKIKE